MPLLHIPRLRTAAPKSDAQGKAAIVLLDLPQ